MITYAIENPAEIIPNITELLAENWDETGFGFEFKPDIATYQYLFDQWLMVAIVVRDDERVIAYCTVLVTPNIHNKQRIEAVNDALFVHKDYRKSTISYRLINLAESEAKRRGAVAFNWHCRQGTPLGIMLEKRGYSLLSAIASKGL